MTPTALTLGPSAPALFALAHGLRCEGDQSCFYCGAACGTTHAARDFIAGTFTNHNEVRRPGSAYVCPGCVLCLRESCEVPFVDGSARQQTKAAVRGWSWLLTPERAVAAGKQHLAALRDVCLNGLSPAPWAVVLSDSGKKHLLYRGAVNLSAEPPWSVTLEGERVTYRPDELRERLSLVGRLVAATGKPSLAEPVDARFAMAVMGRYRDGESYLHEWELVREQPLSRLAAFLSESKEGCVREHASDVELRPVPAEARRAGGPGPRARGGREGRGQGGGDTPLFDLGPPVR